MKRGNLRRRLFPLLAAFVSLSLCGCVELSEPLADAANSTADAKLIGEWKLDLPPLSGGGSQYLRFRPFKQNEAPPALMQAEELDYAPGGNAVITKSVRRYFIASKVGDSQYASVCWNGSSDSWVELAGKDGYLRWLKTKGQWAIVRYQVVDDKLNVWTPSKDVWDKLLSSKVIDEHDVHASLVRYLNSERGGQDLFSGQKTTYVRADLPPRPTSFVTLPSLAGFDLDFGPAILRALCVAGFFVLCLLVIIESFLSSPRKPRASDSRSGKQQGESTSSPPRPYSFRRGAIGGFIGAIGVGFLCLLLLLGELCALAANCVPLSSFLEGAPLVPPHADPQIVHENWLFLGLGAGLGYIAFFLRSDLARRYKKPDPAPPPKWIKRILRGILARSLWGILVGISVFIMVAGASMVMTRARVTAAGWLHGETCFMGLPRSYWMGELRSGIKTKEFRHNGPFYHPSVFLFYDNLGSVTVLSKHIGKEAVPDLVSMLHDQDPVVRQVAVITLARIGPGAVDAAPVLLEQLDKEDVDAIQKDIVDAVELIDPETGNKIGQE
jgi:HEAT repeats